MLCRNTVYPIFWVQVRHGSILRNYMIGILPHFDGVVARWNCITVPKEGLIVHEVDRLIGTVLEVELSAGPVQ